MAIRVNLLTTHDAHVVGDAVVISTGLFTGALPSRVIVCLLSVLKYRDVEVNVFLSPCQGAIHGSEFGPRLLNCLIYYPLRNK